MAKKDKTFQPNSRSLISKAPEKMGGRQLFTIELVKAATPIIVLLISVAAVFLLIVIGAKYQSIEIGPVKLVSYPPTKDGNMPQIAIAELPTPTASLASIPSVQKTLSAVKPPDLYIKTQAVELYVSSPIYIDTPITIIVTATPAIFIDTPIIIIITATPTAPPPNSQLAMVKIN